jgi:hypothetical protein
VYLTIGAGGGVTGVEVSSEEQDKTIAKMLSRKNSFLIKVRFGDKKLISLLRRLINSRIKYKVI